jgi:hypothetical protein
MSSTNQTLAVLMFSDNQKNLERIYSFGDSFFRYLNLEQKEIYKRLKEHYDTYKTSPGKQHIEAVLESSDNQYYLDIFFGNDKERGVDENYVVNDLSDSINRHQTLQLVNDMQDALLEGSQGYKTANALMRNFISQSATSGNSEAVELSKFKALELIEIIKQRKENGIFLSSGIHALDLLGVTPAIGCLTVVLGHTKVGKSRCLDKQLMDNIVKGRKVLRITLEISTNMVLTRLLKLFFKASDTMRPVERFDLKTGSTTFDVPSHMVTEIPEEKLDKLNDYSKLFRVVERPNHTATIHDLENIIATEIASGFQPDLVQIDALINTSYKRGRVDDWQVLPELFGRTRGLGSIFNCAIETVHHAGDARNVQFGNILTSDNMSLAKYISREVDVLLTWNVSNEQRKLGTGVIYVDLAREVYGGDPSGTIILNTFNFDVNNFSVASVKADANQFNQYKEKIMRLIDYANVQ